MKWVRDRTSRFSLRPHYFPAELDSECEKLMSDFLHERHARIEYPVSTDDLTVLIETLTSDLDLYADLSNEEGEVEGVTDFFPGRRPKVRISKQLTLDPGMSNRFRTTLTHELGHVKFHTFMFDGSASGELFGPTALVVSNKCKRDSMLPVVQTDWMEWQAGFACGALLMPATSLRTTVKQFLEEQGRTVGRLAAKSKEAHSLIGIVATTYAVSREAARVRLSQQGTLSEGDLPGVLF